MKYIVMILLAFTLVSAQEQTKQSSQEDDALIKVKDTSGLSADEIRKLAKESDKKNKEKVSLKKVYEVTDEKGKVDLAKIQKTWEELSPHPEKYDWVQTKSGEWFKGDIKALYKDKLEFDSDEVGLYTFDFSDVKQIKSYHIISVNIENLASFSGILRLKDEKITIIQGDTEYEFDRKDLVSFAPSGELERNYWSGKVTVGFDLRSGNTQQHDYSAKVKLQRRTASSRLVIDYLGRITSKDDTETANDHRLSSKYDIYMTRHFFLTPAFGEFYTDKYKNIETQLTLGLGSGYTIVDTSDTEWSVSGGPALLYTQYYTVAPDKSLDSYSPALEISTHYNYDLNKITEITYDYKLTYTDRSAGRYKHHMVLVFENEITSWLDLDFTGVWDYIQDPEEKSNGDYPKRSDFQLLIGLGIEF